MAVQDGFLSVDKDSGSKSGVSKSPLASLRITPMPAAQERNRIETSSTSARNRKIRKKKTLSIKRHRAGPGFDFDADLDDAVGSSEPGTALEEAHSLNDDEGEVLHTPQAVWDHDNNEEKDVGVKRLANFLLESGKAMNVHYNVVDALDDQKGPGTGSGPKNEQKLQISRTTKNRKDTVMAVLSLKYHWLTKCQEDYSGEVKYPGVEGVYNPLQIIRNRAIRAKYHEQPPSLPYATLPLACNVFSSHRKSNGRPWKMLWGVELNELVHDNAWRASHWHELRNPHGELWFPNPERPAHSVISFEDTSNRPNTQNRLHDKLWSEAAGSEEKEQQRLKSSSGRNIGKNIKQKAKRLYGSTSSEANSNSDLENSSNPRQKSFESLLKMKMNNQSKSDSDSNGIYQSPQNNEGSEFFEGTKSSHNLPVIKIDTGITSTNELTDTKGDVQHDEYASLNRSKVNLDDILITPLHSRSQSNIEPQEPDNISLPPPLNDKDIALRKAFETGEYMAQHLNLHHAFLTTVFPHLVRSTSDRCDRILEEKINILLHDIVSVNDSQLPAHESFYTGFLSECKSLMHIINDKYAVKIDHLLSATDRSMGEINTSLTLDMKKVNENLDKVNQSLFGSVAVSSLSRERDVTFTDGGNYKALYFLLENLIVMLLRLTWLVVNIYKFIMFILRIIWKVTSLLFGV
ncbi:hypothetical protein ACI3LY_003476 [Candidozyma auris]|nr:hypothetical protein QG37_00233 [[Candida] auris]